MLKTQEVSLVYKRPKNQDFIALDNVSLTISPGQEIGILGPSGSGKSSLLYLLSGLKKPTKGTVFYKDKDLNQLSSKEKGMLRRREFGFIFQEHFLINHLTVKENILIPTLNTDKEIFNRLSYLLEFLNIDMLVDSFPFELSGGQKQRVAIARALINSPQVIFADEPTASLDTENGLKVLELIREYRKKHNTTLLFVSHNEILVENMEYRYYVEGGRVSEVVR